MKSALALLLLAGVLSVVPGLQAVQMIPLDVAELSRKADLIVQGTVLDQTCQRDAAGRIYTRVNVRVGEVWKGALPTNAPSNTFSIVHSGGTVGEVREEVLGEVEYAVGEEFVAFLVFNQRGDPVTIGLAQGKFHVWQDQQTGEKFAHNVFHGATESAAKAGHARLGLSDLKAVVKKAAP